MATRDEQLQVAGMSCATCSTTIEQAVGELEGVEAVDANFATDTVAVTFDPETTPLTSIYAAIETAGYDPDMTTSTIAVGGMSCATCSATVGEALEAVPGVLEASVNFATDEATVQYNPETASL
ncbi:MAG: heavy-metal-associated domain-containing protein, partial [Halobacteriota archaeon]